MYSKLELIRDLSAYKQLLSENKELESMIKPQSSFPTSDKEAHKTRSFFRYFWPYLLAGYVLYSFIYMVAVFVTMLTYIGNSNVSPIMIMGDAFADTAIGILVGLAVMVFGFVVAKRKVKEFNDNAKYMNELESRRYQDGLKNQHMIEIYQDNINQMRKYEFLVPEQYRDFYYVEQILDLLEKDKAETVVGACALL